jgi:hypothetical protein
MNMHKPNPLALALVLFSSVGIATHGAADNDLWIPIRSSKVRPDSPYPKLPAYKYTNDGWQFIFPDYPVDKNLISPKTGHGSGIVYNKKQNFNGFSLDIKIDELSNPGPNQWLGLAFSDSISFPYWGGRGNAVHLMFQPLANGDLWIRAYTNIDGVQARVFEHRYFGFRLWDADSTIKLVVAKKGKDHVMTVNGEAVDYNFRELGKILPDGGFYPVFSAYSMAPADAHIRYTILRMNGIKPAK